MANNKIRIGITQGDVNGVGYEVILKAFSEPMMLELCTPIIYGSPKVAAYHRKAMDLPTNFSIIGTASEAGANHLSIVNCNAEEVKVEFSKADPQAGKAALEALQKAVSEYKEGKLDVLVTAPINKQVIQSDEFKFPGHTEYLEQEFSEGAQALKIMINDKFRISTVTGHVPISELPSIITKELIEEKLTIFNQSLKKDFGIRSPRIAVFSLNPHVGVNGFSGTEEVEIIKPAIKELSNKGIYCFGPYAADHFMGSGEFSRFDGIMAMYHDQALIPFKSLAMENGVNFTAGLPVVRTSPAHGVMYDITGKGLASEDAFIQAVYMAIDIYRNRMAEQEISRNPLRKQYYDKRDDSDKLKQLANTEDI